MKNNKKLISMAVLVMGSMIALFSNSSSADVMTFSGGICKTFDPTKAGQLQTHHSGVINTSTTSSVVVTCPLARDFNTDVNGANVIVKANRSSSATVPLSCTFVSRDINGASLASNTSQTSATGVVTLSLNVATSGINGYYSVACTLPQSSTLIGLVLTE